MPITKDEAELIKKSCAEHLTNLLARMASQTTLTQSEILTTEGEVKRAFPSNYLELLVVKYEVRGDFRFISVTPKNFIGDQKVWMEICAIVAELCGVKFTSLRDLIESEIYVSEHKTSHFEIPVRRK